MNLKSLLFVSANLLIAGNMAGQTVKIIDETQPGSIEATINADTNTDGTRKDPNTIYELKAGKIYSQSGPIIVNNPTGTLTIRGAQGGPKPVWLKEQVDGIAIGENKIEGSLTFLNIQYETKEDAGTLPTNAFNITGDNHTLRVEDCLIEHSSLIIFMAGQIANGAKIIYRNNYFRDMMDWSQWWGARIGECKRDVDTLILENNTISGGGLIWLSQKSLTNVAIINHNTIINNHKYAILNQYWRECYFTNNLFVNTNMAGEDMENVATGGQDPDKLLMGIFGVDTIEKGIDMPLALMNADSTPGPMIDQISDYVVYAADNVVTYSPTLDNYYNGTADKTLVPSLPWNDAPASYLTWEGKIPPFKVLNVPAIWENHRAVDMEATHPNIKEENNYIYADGYSLADIGLKTDPLPQAAADIFIRWNQVQWGVTGATVVPDTKPYYFGDNDPTTVPGATGEESAAGITKFTDLTEDFSYTKEMLSESDGLPIGAQAWFDLDFDAAASLAAIKAKYSGATAVKPVSSEQSLFVYPNPVKSVLNVKYAKNADITIMNLDGRVVKSVKNVSSVSVSDLADGMYTVTIKSGNEVSKQKVLIAK